MTPEERRQYCREYMREYRQIFRAKVNEDQRIRDARNMSLYRELGAQLQDARERRGLTQKDVAKAIGKTLGTVSRYETGRLRPTPRHSGVSGGRGMSGLPSCVRPWSSLNVYRPRDTLIPEKPEDQTTAYKRTEADLYQCCFRCKLSDCKSEPSRCDACIAEKEARKHA